MTDVWPDELTFQAPDSERALLGAAGHHPDAIAGVLADLPGADFYGFVRGQVWDTCRKLSATHEPLTPVTIARRMVTDKTWSGQAQTIVHVEMSTGTPAAQAGKHAELVADMARRRELLWAVKRAAGIVSKHEGDPSDILAAVRAEFEFPEHGQQDAVGPMGWPALVAEFNAAHGPDGVRPSIATPWRDLDAVLGGLFAGRVYVFGGRPGQGKSTAALNIAMHAAATQQKPTLVISKEMPSLDVTGRLIAAGAEVPLHEVNSRDLSEYSRHRIGLYLERVGRPPITVDARPRTLSGIKTLARAHHHRHGLELLVVDYLQLVRVDTPGRTREQEVAEVSRQMKELAIELNTVVVLPAQLNRGSTMRADPRPTMADLRDSGQIEQDADAVILLHRATEETRQGEIDLIVDKNRHGPTTTITAAWRGGYGAIADLAHQR